MWPFRGWPSGNLRPCSPALLLLLLLLATPTLSSDTDRAISHVSVRLPAPVSDREQVRFLLRAYHGCYQWQAWNRTLVHLEPIPDPHPNGHCASAAFLIPLQAGSTKVVAQDGAETLTCDVFVAPLKWLQVLTTTRTIVVDALHRVTAQGFDEHNNVFNLLQGLRFQWDARAVGGTLASQVIVNLLSPQSAETTLAAALEQAEARVGLEGESVVVRGLRPGRVTLDVAITAMGVRAATVELNIVDHLHIVPPFVPNSLLVLMVNEVTPVPFRLWRRRQGQWSDVDTVKEGFAWASSRHQVASIDQDRGQFLSFAPGEVLVSVSDPFFDANAAQQLVHLVHPVHLLVKFHLLSARGTASRRPPIPAAPFGTQQTHILAGAEYAVEPQVFDGQLRRVYLPQLCPVGLEPTSDPSPYDAGHVVRMDSAGIATGGLHTNHTVAGNFLRLTTLVKGSLQLSLCLSKANDPAVLAGTGMEGRTCVLLARVKVSVDEPLALEPELADRFNRDGVIYLPWGREWRQRYTPRIRGGSGRYLLYTPTNNFFDVDGASLQTKYETGEGVLFLIDEANPDNNLTVTVVVASPATLEVAPGPRDTAVGSLLTLQLLLRDARGKAFTAFDALPFAWTLLNPSLFAQQRHPAQANQLQALLPGSTHVEVVGPNELNAQTFIAAFPPLSGRPDKELLLGVLGSTILLELHGGPTQVHTFPSQLHTSVAVGTGPARAELRADNLVAVVCDTAVEAQTLRIVRQHNSSAPGATPTEYVLERHVGCGVPTGLRLAPASRAGVAVGERLNSYNVYMRGAGEELAVEAIFTDSAGRAFVAHESLDLQWSVSDRTVAALMSPLADPSARLALLQPGETAIKAQCHGYTARARRSGGPKLLSSVLLVVLTSLTVTPERGLLWASPAHFQAVTVTGGSGRYTYGYPPRAALQVTERRGGNGLNVRWVGGAEELPQEVAIKVQDVVYDYASATAVLQVADVHSLSANVTRLLAQLGTTQWVQLAAAAASGDAFPAEQCALMGPAVALSGRSAEVADRSGCLFEVKAMRPGQTVVHFSVSNAVAQPVRTVLVVEVYREETLWPREVALRSGVQFGLGFVGGPPGTVRAALHFSSDRTAVAAVDAQGLVTAGRGGVTDVRASWKRGEQTLSQSVHVVTVETLTGVQFNVAHAKRTVAVGEVFTVFAIGEGPLPDHSGKKVLLTAPFYYRPGHTYCRWAVLAGPLELLPTVDRCAALLRATAGGPGQVALTLLDGTTPHSATLDVIAVAAVPNAGGLLLPPATSYPLPFPTVRYTVDSPTPTGLQLLSAGNLLQTDQPTTATLRAASDTEEGRKVIAVNVAFPRHLSLSAAGPGCCGCSNPAQANGGSVVLKGGSATLWATLFEDRNDAFDFFSEDDVKVISNRPTVAQVDVQSAGDVGSAKALRIHGRQSGHVLLEVAYASRPAQRSDWAAGPAYPVQGTGPQAVARPAPPVVVATWPVWVVDRAESLDVPPNVVLHFQGKGRAVGVVITDDADRCTASANLVAVNYSAGQCRAIYTDPDLTYSVNVSVRPVEAARFPHRALAALAPLRRGPYAAKLPVMLHATGARPLATRYRTAIPDKLAPLLSSEPAPVFETDEALVAASVPDQLRCAIQGGDVQTATHEPRFQAEIIAQHGQLYCLVYAELPKGTSLNNSHFATTYEVVLSWAGRPTDVLPLRALEGECAAAAPTSWRRWLASLFFTALALGTGLYFLAPVLLAMADGQGTRPVHWDRPGAAGPPRAAPMLIPRAAAAPAAPPAAAPAVRFNPFGAPPDAVPRGLPARPFGFQ